LSGNALKLLRRSLRYLRPYRRWIALYLTAWLVSVAFESSVPLAIRAAIDGGIVGRDPHRLATAVVTALGLYIGKTLFGFASGYTYHFYEAAMAKDLRAELFRRLQEYS